MNNENYNETKQTCKQCGLRLPVEAFKQYTSRSEGLRRTTTGRYTICKHCEKLSAHAAKLQKLYESGKATEADLEAREALRNYYQCLVDKGLPLVTAPVRRLMGVADEPKKRGAKNKVLDLIAEAAARQEATRVEAKIDREVKAAITSTAKEIVEGHTLADVPEEPEKEYGLVDIDIMKALDILNELLECEFVREPEYYEAMCDDALQVLRDTTEDGKVPSAYTALASQVLEKLDDYADSYEG